MKNLKRKRMIGIRMGNPLTKHHVLKCIKKQIKQLDDLQKSYNDYMNS
jgi:hypothetical protein